MPLVSHVGGSSLTGAVVALVTIVALAVRVIKRRASRAQHGAGRNQQTLDRPPRFLGSITPAALRLLIETDAVPHVVVQITQPEEQSLLPHSLAQKAITLTTDTALSVLAGPQGQWQSASHAAETEATTPATHAAREALPAPDEPRRGELVCVVANTASVAHSCACTLAANGFHRVTTTVADSARGGGTAAGPGVQDGTGSSGLWGGEAVQLRYLGRDGLAALLGYRDQPIGVPHVLLDVRRHDERTLYGLIRGSVHVPVEQLPSALELPPDEFMALYRFPRPAPGVPLVLVGRTSRRAAWAAQVCEDAGLWPVLVYRQGVQGWKLDESVKPYRQYRIGDRPPEPDVFQVEMPDEDRGLEELFSLGLLAR